MMDTLRFCAQVIARCQVRHEETPRCPYGLGKEVDYDSDVEMAAGLCC